MKGKCKKCGAPLTAGNICSRCGLPEDLCVCATIQKEEEKIKVWVEKRRYGKSMTVIEGIKEEPKRILSFLKSKLACGGTFKNGRFELQGDHRGRIKDLLVKLGFEEGNIEIIE